jgi:putative SOS response-associated peptidase YedK
MCGRYTLTLHAERLAQVFGLSGIVEELKARYNIAPRQLIATVGRKPKSADRGLAMLRWGLVPSWSDNPNPKMQPINAKSETVATSPFFRTSFGSRRCLVPATGFYEWKLEGKKKVARHIRMKDGEPFAFAGIWDTWGKGPERLSTACILTTKPNELVAEIHDRMPLILPRESYEAWLDPATDGAELKSLMVPYPADRMEAVRVGPAVNKVGNEGAGCVEPADN